MKLGIVPKFIFILLLIINLSSCDSQSSLEEQAKIFFTSLQDLNIDKCVDMTYAYQVNLAKIQGEPQFKKDNLIGECRNEIRKTILNQYDNNNIVHIFRFPCQWRIVEIKEANQESSNGIFCNTSSVRRIFVAVSYKSIDNSPESVPLINNDSTLMYKIREILLHCEFDPDSGLYMSWGLDKDTRW